MCLRWPTVPRVSVNWPWLAVKLIKSDRLYHLLWNRFSSQKKWYPLYTFCVEYFVWISLVLWTLIFWMSPFPFFPELQWFHFPFKVFQFHRLFPWLWPLISLISGSHLKRGRVMAGWVVAFISTHTPSCSLLCQASLFTLSVSPWAGFGLGAFSAICSSC